MTLLEHEAWSSGVGGAADRQRERYDMSRALRRKRW